MTIRGHAEKFIDFDLVGPCFAPVLRLSRSQNQFSTPGVGVNKLSFKRFGLNLLILKP